MPAGRWWKFLAPGATGAFSGFRWPAPDPAGPGRWVDADGPPDPCRSGLHLCRARDLPYWLGEELYTVHVEGPLVEGRSFVIASRARLVERVAAWDRDRAVRFGQACAEAARDAAARTGKDAADGVRHRLGEYAADAARFAAEIEAAADWWARAATVALVAATASARATGGQDGWARERARQAGWLEYHVLTS